LLPIIWNRPPMSGVATWRPIAIAASAIVVVLRVFSNSSWAYYHTARQEVKCPSEKSFVNFV
jgi:hypothetical protein